MRALGHVADYWWNEDASERFWIEIRWFPGLGESLVCPLKDKTGKTNPWYDLLDVVRVGDIVYHWHAHQNCFVGRSTVLDECSIRNGERYIPLGGFKPLPTVTSLSDVRSSEPELRACRDHLLEQHPGKNLYLPFQFRSDNLRFMTNYFTKCPKAMQDLFWSRPIDPPNVTEDYYGIPKSRYLTPFKSKADTRYWSLTHEKGVEKSRTHETLVNEFSDWLLGNGLVAGRNQAIDIGIESPAAIVEAKSVTSWARDIRQAVGQLYEYRYFQVVPPDANLLFLSSKEIPCDWINYLESDRSIGVAWKTSDGFHLTTMAKGFLGL